MPEPDLDLLIEAARGAARIARPYWSGENTVWEKGPDDPVSEADLAVDTYLRESLTAARPGYGWLSEETEDSDHRLSAERVFVVDPIDGTRAFIKGEKTWAHSIGLVENGTPLAGVVYLPLHDALYAATRGGGATLNGAQIRTSYRGGANGASILANRHAFDPAHWPGGLPDARRAFRPSLAYRLCLVAEGRFDGMLTLRDSWEWDLAAGTLIATEAGAMVSDRHGGAPRFNRATPAVPGLVVAPKPLHADLISRLGAAP